MHTKDPKIIVALDFEDVEAANRLVQRLSPALCRLKVGKQLFTQQGPAWIAQLVDKGFDVFLDLKFHDIPHTVASACKEAAKLGVWMVNVHASGGMDMLAAAKEGVLSANTGHPAPKLIGVTILTSLVDKDLAAIGMQGTVMEQVTRLAGLCQQAGLDGVVCSAQEAQTLRRLCGPDFLLVTPGIRLAENATQDQKRIVTPRDAMAWGASYLVIGRPITQAADPVQVIETIESSLMNS